MRDEALSVKGSSVPEKAVFRSGGLLGYRWPSRVHGFLLGQESVQQRNLLRPETITNWMEEQRTGKQDRSMQIWQLLTLKLWMRVFIDTI